MTKKDEEIRKKDAILTCTQIINIPKYKVKGHGTSPIELESDGTYSHALESPPKGTTDILVIYLKR